MYGNVHGIWQHYHFARRTLHLLLQDPGQLAPQRNAGAAMAKDIAQPSTERPTEQSLLAREHLEHLQPVRVNDQPITETINAFPYTEALREDHIGFDLIELI